jgi:hypothetical protein
MERERGKKNEVKSGKSVCFLPFTSVLFPVFEEIHIPPVVQVIPTSPVNQLSLLVVVENARG